MGVSEERGSAIAAGEWQCIHIPQGRVFLASYRTFIGTLHADHSINFDMRTEYPVYSAPAPEGDGMCFFLFTAGGTTVQKSDQVLGRLSVPGAEAPQHFSPHLVAVGRKENPLEGARTRGPRNRAHESTQQA